MKLIAPANISHFEMDGLTYSRGEDGLFEIGLPQHVDAAIRMGAVEFVPGMGDPFAPPPPVEQAQSDHSDLSALFERMAAVEKRLSALEAAHNPSHGTDVSGDTSTGTGGARDDVIEDKIGALLDENPDFDKMDRDEMVEWLAKAGVVIPGNVSKETARKTINETLTDYQKSLGE